MDGDVVKRDAEVYENDFAGRFFTETPAFDVMLHAYLLHGAMNERIAGYRVERFGGCRGGDRYIIRFNMGGIARELHLQVRTGETPETSMRRALTEQKLLPESVTV